MTTLSIVADNIGTPESVISPVNCKKVTIQEANGLASASYYVRAPLIDSPAVLVPAGYPFSFIGRWGGEIMKGETAAFIETSSGTLTFSVVFE